MSPPRKVRPTLADLEKDGPALSPKDFALIAGIGRDSIVYLCQTGGIPAFRIGAHWKISRAVALDQCRRMKLRPNTAA